MGWISPTSNSGSQASASSGSITSPLRIAKRDSPRSLPQPPVARRTSSSYRHVRDNNLVSKSPFKSQIPTHSPSPARPVSFPSPRRVSGEKRPRPSSMHYQAEDENERPFALKRERRQSKAFQGLIQKEPVSKSPFKQPAASTEEQSLSPPPPLLHLLPAATSSSLPPAAHPSLAPLIGPTTSVSPGRSSLVSRRMHGPRLSSGSQSRRQRRKTVTWDENCDVVEISADENETDSENEEEQRVGVGNDYEQEPQDDPFFRGDQPQKEDRIMDEPSYDSNDPYDGLSDDGPSLGLDPDASISGLVEEMFASSSPGVTTSTPPRQLNGSHFPPDLDTEDGIPLGRSHHAARFLQHQREYSHSPKTSPPHFSSPSSRLGSPIASSSVGPSHLATPPLGRSTHAERYQLARTEDCEDVLMLPGTPSPSKITRNPDHPDTRHGEKLIPKFEVDIGSSSSSIDPSSTSLEDPFSLPTLVPPIAHQTLVDGSATKSADTQDTSANEPQLTYTPVSEVSNQMTLTVQVASLTNDFIEYSSERRSANFRFRGVSPSKTPDSKSPSFSRNDTSLEDDSCSSIPDSISSQVNDEEIQAEDTVFTVTNLSTEIGVIGRAERKPMTRATVMEGEQSSPVDVAKKLEFDFGSRFGRGLDLGDIDSGIITGTLDGFEVIRGPSKEETPSVQSGSSMRMGDLDVAMDMRSALDRLMDDVAGTHADDTVTTEDDDSLEILQPPKQSIPGSRIMERAATDSALLHNNGFVNRNVSLSSESSIPPPPPSKNNIRSRERMILEKRREARRLEEPEESIPPTVGRDDQRLLGVGRPSRRRSMSTGDADILGGGAKKRGDILLDVVVGDIDRQDGELGDSIEKELKKMVAAPIKNKMKYHVRERESTIYASSSDPDIVSHMAGPGDVNVGKAWRPVRRPSDMNEYSKQIKEYRAQEKLGKAYGKVFVKVLGVKNIHIPLPRQPTFLTCTLNNGIHFVSTPEFQLGRDCRIEQEFELIEHSKLEFTLTLKVRRDPHVVAQFKELTPPPQAPVVSPPVIQNPSKGGMRSFFHSSPKKSSKDKLPVQAFPPPPQSVQRLPENLARHLKPDGTMARAFISFKEIAPRCDTRLFETSYPLIGQRVEIGGKFSTLQAGEIVLQIFRLPPLPGIASEQLPQSLEECHRGLRHINWHKVTYFEGILTQLGGDCSTWRRRQLRVIGANLIAFNDVTKKATATIDLKKAIAVEDNQEGRRNALTPGGVSRYDEDDGLYGVERSFRLVFPHGEDILFFADTDDEKTRWLDVFRALVGHIPPHPFWAELLWQRQEELTRTRQPSSRPPPHSSPSWLVSKGPQR
ncbi:Bud site selection protein BUD4 [Termitomyces sp. J132]|nr:Bud site selection protein BUD4 [Termitomyces sp. J132]